MRTGHGLGILLALGFTTAAQPATAQESMPNPGPTGGLERRATILLSARATYDSAVSRARPPGDFTGPLREEDVLYSPSATLDVVLPLGPLYTYAQGSAGYEFYQSNPKLDSARIDLAGGVGGKLGPCASSLSGAWARGQTHVEDTTLRISENVVENRSVSFVARCLPFGGLVTTIGASYTDTNNTAERAVTNSEGAQIDAAVGYGAPSLGVIALVGQYQKTDYSRPNAAPGLLLSPGYEVYNVGLQYERPVGRRLLGRVGAGYSLIKSQDRLSKDRNALTLDVALDYAPSRRLTTSLSYARNTSPSNIEGVSYSIGDQVRASASYQLTSRLNASLGAGWSKRSYKGVIDPRVFGAPSEQEILNAGAGLSTRIGLRSTLSLDAEYQDRHTDVPSLSFDSVRVGVTASTSF